MNRTIHTFHVDLTENDEYREHKDNIESLEAIGIEVKLGNLTATDVVEGYISSALLDTTSADSIKTGTMVLRAAAGYVDPDGTRVIDFEESQAYFYNFDAIEDAVRQGTFYFYTIGRDRTQIEYEDLTLVITLNVEM